jgi:hypothetical protein
MRSIVVLVAVLFLSAVTLGTLASAQIPPEQSSSGSTARPDSGIPDRVPGSEDSQDYQQQENAPDDSFETNPATGQQGRNNQDDPDQMNPDSGEGQAPPGDAEPTPESDPYNSQ